MTSITTHLALDEATKELRKFVRKEMQLYLDDDDNTFEGMVASVNLPRPRVLSMSHGTFDGNVKDIEVLMLLGYGLTSDTLYFINKYHELLHEYHVENMDDISEETDRFLNCGEYVEKLEGAPTLIRNQRQLTKVFGDPEDIKEELVTPPVKVESIFSPVTITEVDKTSKATEVVEDLVRDIDKVQVPRNAVIELTAWQDPIVITLIAKGLAPEQVIRLREKLVEVIRNDIYSIPVFDTIGVYAIDDDLIIENIEDLVDESSMEKVIQALVDSDVNYMELLLTPVELECSGVIKIGKYQIPRGWNKNIPMNHDFAVPIKCMQEHLQIWTCNTEHVYSWSVLTENWLIGEGDDRWRKLSNKDFQKLCDEIWVRARSIGVVVKKIVV